VHRLEGRAVTRGAEALGGRREQVLVELEAVDAGRALLQRPFGEDSGACAEVEHGHAGLDDLVDRRVEGAHPDAIAEQQLVEAVVPLQQALGGGKPDLLERVRAAAGRSQVDRHGSSSVSRGPSLGPVTTAPVTRSKLERCSGQVMRSFAALTYP
jgi:hypothetical protein